MFMVPIHLERILMNFVLDIENSVIETIQQRKWHVVPTEYEMCLCVLIMTKYIVAVSIYLYC